MEILATLFFMASMIAVVLGSGIFLVKINLPTKEIKEMDKMEDFFKSDKRIIKDLDSFFAEQWKSYYWNISKHAFGLIIGSILAALLLGFLLYFSNEKDYIEAGVVFLGGTGIYFFVACICTVKFLLDLPKHKKSFFKAKEKFREAYPSYTNQRLSREIVKADNDRLEIVALYPKTQIIWFCSDFLLYCTMFGYRFTFIRYADIENLEIRKYKTNSYNFAKELEYSFYIHYRVKGKEKKLYFVQLSVYGILEEFEKRNIEIIWKGDGFERDK